jgi:hypothetical protein
LVLAGGITIITDRRSPVAGMFIEGIFLVQYTIQGIVEITSCGISGVSYYL